MKYLLGLILFGGCASYHKKELPPFDKTKICSDASLAQYKKPHKVASHHSSPEEVESKMTAIKPDIQSCYQTDIERTKNVEDFHLCLVINYDPKGKIQYFEFSNRNMTLSSELLECLSKIKTKNEIQGLKNVLVLQPVRMHVK
ncbi:hypothetical protein ACJVC5_01100 [Peredibacter sp. HCB2-198]|uniref:hypothetical protein n=1 Tax=Peredibacter sp. HCB2-198 TaxID=3383025 RepID=UPI0038B51276